MYSSKDKVRKQERKTKTRAEHVNFLAEINRKLEFAVTENGSKSMEHSVQMLSDRYDGVLKRPNAQGNDIDGLKKRVDQIERAGTEHEVQELKSQLSDLERRSRRQKLEIHGACETEREDLLSVVNDVAAKLGVDDLKSEVLAVHRLSQGIRKVLVRFPRQETRELWLSKKRALNKAFEWIEKELR